MKGHIRLREATQISLPLLEASLSLMVSDCGQLKKRPMEVASSFLPLLNAGCPLIMSERR